MSCSPVKHVFLGVLSAHAHENGTGWTCSTKRPSFLNGSEPVQQSGYDPEIIYAQERLKKNVTLYDATIFHIESSASNFRGFNNG